MKNLILIALITLSACELQDTASKSSSNIRYDAVEYCVEKKDATCSDPVFIMNGATKQQEMYCETATQDYTTNVILTNRLGDETREKYGYFLSTIGSSELRIYHSYGSRPGFLYKSYIHVYTTDPLVTLTGNCK